MRKRCATNLASQCPLQARDLVLKVLRALTICRLCRFGPNALERVADTLHLSSKPIADNGKVRGQSAVVINEKGILELLRRVAADKLSDNLGADRRPDVVHSVLLADLLSVVERLGGVSVRDDEDVLRREDIDGCP